MTTAQLALKKDVLHFSGDWTAKGIAALGQDPLRQVILPTFPITLDGSTITDFDTAGAWAVDKLLQALVQQNVSYNLTGFSNEQQNLINLVKDKEKKITESSPPTKESFFPRVGRGAINKFFEFCIWMTFVGKFTHVSVKLLATPWRIKWKSLLSVIELMGYRALPIIAFLSLLIGVVITYQIGLELKIYGANIYIISLLGTSIFREFAPLITAIILAGRTSSAFTAQLGLMKANEEIDALKTMGLSPTELLILPRIVGLVIVTPLLTVWSAIFALLGGMMMTQNILGISYYSFIIHFPEDVTSTSFLIGVLKAPIFGLIIAIVGCFHGMRVTGSSESIGWEITKSVVLSLFLIIIADALFSIALSWAGI